MDLEIIKELWHAQMSGEFVRIWHQILVQEIVMAVVLVLTGIVIVDMDMLEMIVN